MSIIVMMTPMTAADINIRVWVDRDRNWGRIRVHRERIRIVGPRERFWMVLPPTAIVIIVICSVLFF